MDNLSIVAIQLFELDYKFGNLAECTQSSCIENFRSVNYCILEQAVCDAQTQQKRKLNQYCKQKNYPEDNIYLTAH